MIKKINIISYLLMVILSILMSISIIKLNIIPNKYLYPLLIAIIIIAIIIGLITFKTKSKIIQIILIIITLLIAITELFANQKINETNNFIQNLEQVEETSVYYVMVLKESPYKNIKDLTDKKIGSYNIDLQNYPKAKKELSNIITYKEITYQNISNLTNDMLSQSIDAMYINSNIKTIIEENESLNNKFKVIKNIKIKLETSNQKQVSKTNNDYFNIYISGIDTYGQINTVSRSDVNIIMTVNRKQNKILLTTIPRDSYVQLYGTSGSLDKLTHAGIYGINTSVKTIEDFLNIDIDYYLRINFDTLINVIDSIGGIEVYSDVAFTSGGYTFNEGLNQMDGKKALAFSRERKQFKEGDRLRGKHQQAVITGVINKVTSSTTLLTNYSSILNSLANTFQTNIPSDLIKDIFKTQLEKMKSWNINSISVNGTGSYSTNTYSMPGWNLYVMIPDQKTVDDAHQKIIALQN